MKRGGKARLKCVWYVQLSTADGGVENLARFAKHAETLSHLGAHGVDSFETVHHEIFDPCTHAFAVEVYAGRQKTRSDARKRFSGPRLKPVDHCTRYKRREFAGPVAKLRRHRREAQNHMKIFPNLTFSQERNVNADRNASNHGIAMMCVQGNLCRSDPSLT